MRSPQIRASGARSAPRTQRPIAALLAGALLALAGCSGGDLPLAPVHRLNALLEAPPPKDAPESCQVADEYRPSIGCLAVLPMVRTTIDMPAARVVEVDAILPRALRGGMVVVEPKARAGRGSDFRRAPSIILPRQAGRSVALAIPLPRGLDGEEVTVQAFGRPVPPAEQSQRTRPVKVGRGAVLQVGLGLERLAGIPASPVAFRLGVATADGEHSLLEATLDPEGGQGWKDHRVDLADWSGQTVRFVFATRVVPRPGQDPDTAMGFPLWGAPQLVEPRRRDGRRNVVLVSLDTLRGDHVEGELDGVRLMPELERIAQRGALFTDAISTYPSTTAAHMSMFTGLYPAVHQTIFATGTLSDEVPTLPQILAANGYATGAVTENAMLAAQAGFVRGFDSYLEFKGPTMWDTAGEIERTFGAGFDWLERHRDERFFLFLHTYQVHAPYEPPAEYDVFKTWVRDGERVPIDRTTPKEIVQRNLYAGEVRYTDVAVARLVARLRELGVADETILVITSDHGDEFGEHGLIGHAKTTYDEVLHVPLVMVAPGLVPAGRRVETPVSLVDLAPTLLDLVRITPLPGMQGRSLVPLLRGERFPAERVLYAEAPPWGPKTGRRFSARVAGFKWIASALPEVPLQVYDLTSDPGEQRPLDDTELAAIGEQLLASYREADAEAARRLAGAADPLAPVQPGLDERTVEKLKLLGYVDE